MMKELKKAKRKEMLDLRASLDPDYMKRSDAAITENILQSDAYRQAKVIFSFVSMPGEFDTQALIEGALSQSKVVCVPRVISKGIMEAYQIQSFDDFEVSSYGIREPKEGSSLIDPSQIDLGIIPNIVVSLDGYRLGYGGGFYDRFLLRSDMLKYAVCRDRLIQDTLPVEDHDQRMDAIVSEFGIVEVN